MSECLHEAYQHKHINTYQHISTQGYEHDEVPQAVNIVCFHWRVFSIIENAADVDDDDDTPLLPSIIS